MLFKNLRILIYSSFLLLISCSSSNYRLTIAPIFSNHMVLQQDSKVSVWGAGRPGETVSISTSWGEDTKADIKEDGNWDLKIKTPEYGGPFSIKVKSGKDEVILEDVLIGEVWIASGQSNMEWKMKGRISNGEEEIRKADFAEIRMFTMPRNLTSNNLDKASWKITTPENVADFSAVGYFFAREIHKKLGVPIGIINSSWGGTRIEAWTSIEQLAMMNESKKEAQEIILQGGLELILQNKVKSNLESRKRNETYLNSKSFDLPETIEDWNSLELGDINFSKLEYDDSDWSKYNYKRSNNEPFSFEAQFNQESIASDGVMWIRKNFDLENPEKQFSFIAEGGIDDFDYTYINGSLIGSDLYCCRDRNYDISKGLLKEKGNVIAIRIIDNAGNSGFRGPIYLKNDDEKITLDFGELKFKHHAFILNSSIQTHNFLTDQLVNESLSLNENIEKGHILQNPNMYGILYNGMIKPIIGYGIKGFLWYQGESNVPNYHEYPALFNGMISDWRKKWKNDSLPFYYVQIAPYKYSPEAKSQELRDAQRRALTTKKTGMAITMDIGEENDIHPSNKQDVGLRLARLALYNDYGIKDLIPSGPLYKSHKVEGNKVFVFFDYSENGLFQNGPLLGFEVGDDKGNFFPATAVIEGNSIVLSSTMLSNPKHVRYGWQNFFQGNLFNKDNLPASSFTSF